MPIFWVEQLVVGRLFVPIRKGADGSTVCKTASTTIKVRTLQAGWNKQETPLVDYCSWSYSRLAERYLAYFSP
jgi:hypothetical protein